MKKLKILTEASGSLTSSYLAKAIREAGHIVCGSDINNFNAAFYDDFILMPRANDPQLWDKTLSLLQQHSIDIVIPTIDESLLGWSERVELFAQYGILVLISPPHTIATFIDKWKTYEFFTAHNIPTPHTALYEPKRILKPRYGRGGSGIEYIQQEKYYGGGGKMETIKHIASILPKKKLKGKNTPLTAFLIKIARLSTLSLANALALHRVNPRKEKSAMSSV